jgi:hypothetical protein
MRKDHISTPEKTEQLKKELAEWHEEPAFIKCSTAGDIVKMHLKEMLRKNLQLIPKLSGRFED